MINIFFIIIIIFIYYNNEVLLGYVELCICPCYLRERGGERERADKYPNVCPGVRP